MKLAFLAIFALSCFAQPTYPRGQAIKTTALVASAEKITVQQPPASPVQVQFEIVDVTCTAAVTVTFSWNGTAATSTPLTPVGVMGATINALAFSASNVGAGTTGKSYSLAANQTQPFDISLFQLPKGGGGANNLTLATNAITGTCVIQFQWREI